MAKKNIKFNSNYQFIGITSQKKKQWIINILSHCKEIKDTVYPLKDSLVTELKIDSFNAYKDKDVICVDGKLSLHDNEKIEERSFIAYITESPKETHVYLDITRLNVTDEPKMIRTSETFTEEEDYLKSITNYSQTDCLEEKTFINNFPKEINFDQFLEQMSQQLSAL